MRRAARCSGSSNPMVTLLMVFPISSSLISNWLKLPFRNIFCSCDRSALFSWIPSICPLDPTIDNWMRSMALVRWTSTVFVVMKYVSTKSESCSAKHDTFNAVHLRVGEGNRGDWGVNSMNSCWLPFVGLNHCWTENLKERNLVNGNKGFWRTDALDQMFEVSHVLSTNHWLCRDFRVQWRVFVSTCGEEDWREGFLSFSLLRHYYWKVEISRQNFETMVCFGIREKVLELCQYFRRFECILANQEVQSVPYPFLLRYYNLQLRQNKQRISFRRILFEDSNLVVLKQIILQIIFDRISLDSTIDSQGI